MRLLLGAGLVGVAGAWAGWLALGPQVASGPLPAPMAAADQELIQAVHGALDAWARFAVFGDLDVLDGHFHPDGPQYTQLQSEAVGIRAAADAGPPYRFQVQQAAVREMNSRKATVYVNATLKRRGEADRRYRWVLELRHQPQHGWTVWSVATSMYD